MLMRPGETFTPGAKTMKNKLDVDARHTKRGQEASEQEQNASVESAGSAWQYNGDAGAAADPQTFVTAQTPEISWTASEYISHDKGGGWFGLVMLAGLLLAGVIYLFTREWISSGAVGAGVLLFAVYGIRPPQTLEYAVDSRGIHIGARSYPYAKFRSFSVLEDDALHSIMLMPMKRFELPITVYFDPADEEQIVNVIGGHLPHEDRQTPPIDRLMSKIRF